MKINNICCIGAGYVGGPTMAVIADRCPKIQVTVVDINSDRIRLWNSDSLPIYEPGLDDIIKERRGVNLHFSVDIDNAIANADCDFISVNTPTKRVGHGAGKASDLKFLESSARRIALAAKGHTIVVEKSTLPVRSAETVRSVLNALGDGKTFDILSNPEFMAEGSAISDLTNPDRVLVGGESESASESLISVYNQWVPREKIIKTNLWSSEMAKLASNALLAQRVSSINSLSAFCEATGADINEVADVVGRDSRIGKKFLRSGPGFGGSCFKKDILNLVYLCQYYGLHEVAEYWEQVLKINEWQNRRIARVILNKMYGTLSGKRIAILGFAFKKDTDDVRESPAIGICRDLLEEGAIIVVHDPKVSAASVSAALENEGYSSKKNIIHTSNIVESFDQVDAAVVVTDWDEYRMIQWSKVANTMRKPAWIFDTRCALDSEQISNAGLNYWSLGRTSKD